MNSTTTLHLIRSDIASDVTVAIASLGVKGPLYPWAANAQCLSAKWHENHNEQECISVWCVPPVLYRIGAVSVQRVVSVQRGSLSRGSLSRVVSVQEGSLCPRRPPPLWTDRRLWKYYLAPNFVCGRQKFLWDKEFVFSERLTSSVYLKYNKNLLLTFQLVNGLILLFHCFGNLT